MTVDITAEINFFSHTTDGSAPWMDSSPKLVTLVTNFARTPSKINIQDLRGKENSYDLDTNGFELLKYDGQVIDVFDDNSDMQRCYYEEISNILKKRLGASRVIVFNHISRARGLARTEGQCDPTHKNPVFYPHVDSDPPAAHFKLKEVVGEEEAEKVIQKRFQIINVWRPLGPNPIVNRPLALCDYRSINLDKDLHVCSVHGSPATISLYVLSHSSENAQKWYYLNEMRTNEMFVFKIFDTKSDVAQFGAHTAINNDQVPLTFLEQHSVEMRCLVFYD